mgnify:FL=1
MSKRKIYDIMPPNEAKKVENTIKSLGVKNRKKRVSKKESGANRAPVSFAPPQNPPKKSPLLKILIGAGAVVLTIGIFLFYKLPKAEIQIYPNVEENHLEENISADKSVKNINLSKKIIPAEYIEIEKESAEEFMATGSAEDGGKASGNITIYNKISPSSPLTLKTGTHFLSDSGKYFVTSGGVTIPGMKGKTPGSVIVKVQAEEFGESYNIGPSKFSVPKLTGTSYYYSIWAESRSPMLGGYSGKIKKVTEDDIQTAKNALVKKLIEKAESELKGKIKEGQILTDTAISRSVVSAESDKKPGAVADKFIETAKVKVSALVFKSEDLKSFTKNSIISSFKADKNLLEESLSLNYSTYLVDLGKGVIKINLKASGKTYYDIDIKNLTALLAGKSERGIRGIINSEYEGKIAGIKIKLWPFWVKKAPQNKNRVKITLNFD